MSGLSAELSLQNHVPKIPFDILMYFFPDLLPPPSHGPAATVLWAQLERNRFLQQHPRHWYGWVLTHHSLFPLKQSLLLPGSPAPCSVALLGWMVVVVVLVLLSFCAMSNFFPSGILECLLGEAGLLQFLSLLCYLSRTAISSFFSWLMRVVGEGFLLCWFHSLY